MELHHLQYLFRDLRFRLSIDQFGFEDVSHIRKNQLEE